ncbi:hypothetical protein BDD12DRAFT_911236 [Trichophaea hybrida]|nr:hypothetical protein BDD12DRAFT_911236 [Trichophaea hybrida]
MALEALGIAVKAGEKVYRYTKSARGYPETVAKLQKGLDAVKESPQGLRGIPNDLNAAVQTAGDPPPRISRLSTALDDCDTTLRAIMDDLECHSANKWRERFGRRLKWPMKESMIVEFTTQLSTYQHVFNRALQVDIAGVETGVQDVRTGVQEVKTSVQNVQLDARQKWIKQQENRQKKKIEAQQKKMKELVKWLAPLH